MNEEPPSRERPDDVDEAYRRASERDGSQPSEAVRRAILAHATRLAAERAAANEPRRVRRIGVHRPLIFGTLAAAALAGLMVLPRLLAPSATRDEGTPVVQERQDPGVQSIPAVTPPPAALQPPRAVEPTAPAAAAADAVTAQEARTATAPSAREAPPVARAEASVDRAEAAPPEAAPQAGPADRTEAARAAGPAALTETQEIALRRAAEAGDLSSLQTLLDTEVDIDSRDDMGRTALMLAILRGQADSASLLLEHGADPNAVDARGTTPLQVAMSADEQAIVAALRRKGAR
jgi:Ankyrin repeats (3 copies)